MKMFLRIGAVTLKELKQLSRDRMSFGMIVMIPIIQLLLFGFAINTNIRNIPVGLVDQDKSSLSRMLAQSLMATQVVDIVATYNTVAEGEAAITRGDVRAVLVLPDDLPQRVSRSPLVAGRNGTAGDVDPRPLGQWLVDGSDTMVAGAIKGLRSVPLNDVFRTVPAVTGPAFEVVLYFNPEQRTVINIVPGLVAIILTMTMIMFTSAAIVRERERGNLEFLITTPVKSMELMIGKIIPYIFVGLLQMTIILTLGHFAFGVPIQGSWLQIFMVTLLFISASLTLGLIISTIARTQLQSMQMTIFILLPSILLSGFMFPYEGMPEVTQWIAEALPATHFVRLIRGVVLRDAGIGQLVNDSIFLALFTVGGLIIAAVKFKKRLD